MSHAAIHVGTSGWNYRHWKDNVYRGRKQREWLPYLARFFNAIEINTSFYRIPSESAIHDWQQATPSQLQFAVKMWRGITHYRKLANCEDLLARFFDVVDQLENRRGPVLVQLPPHLQKDLQRLDAFLKQLREITGRRWQVAVEFRHDSWLTVDVYRLLDRRRAAVCLHDRTGQGAAQEPNDASFVYVRRHGPTGGRYWGRYTKTDIEKDAQRLLGWQANGKSSYIFFNNDVGGHAFRNARSLCALLAGFVTVAAS
jgi:uncharacterized protein YecE (DUF72 family)